MNQWFMNSHYNGIVDDQSLIQFNDRVLSLILNGIVELQD